MVTNGKTNLSVFKINPIWHSRTVLDITCSSANDRQRGSKLKFSGGRPRQAQTASSAN